MHAPPPGARGSFPHGWVRLTRINWKPESFDADEEDVRYAVVIPEGVEKSLGGDEGGRIRPSNQLAMPLICPPLRDSFARESEYKRPREATGT